MEKRIEDNVHHITVEAIGTASPVDATITFRDGRKVNVRLDEKTLTGGPYTVEDVQSIVYYTATGSPELSLGTIDGVTGEYYGGPAGGSMKD